jgi:hypothetical protein
LHENDGGGMKAAKVLLGRCGKASEDRDFRRFQRAN